LNPKCQELQVELADYLAGSPSAGVEAHLLECDSCRANVALWHRMADVPVAAPATALPGQFRRKLTPPRRSVAPWLAAAAALLAGLTGYWAGGRNNDLTALRKEVRGLREVVALSLLDQRSASERLRGIRFSTAIENEDPEVVAALTRTLRADPSVDVRLAAADALRRFRLPQSTRETAWQLLHSDDSPLVHIAAVDLLAAARDPRLPALAAEARLHPSVIEYLQAVLSNKQNRGNTFQ